MHIPREVVLSLLLLVSGCGGVGNIKSDIAPIQQTSFELVDARDEMGKVTRKESAGNTRVCHLIGDDKFSPAVPKQLETYLFQNCGDKLRGKKIELTRADIRVYELTASEMPLEQKLAAMPPGNPVAATIAALLLSDSLEKSFSKNRIEVELEGSMEGRVIQAGEYGSNRFGSPEREIQALLKKAMERFSKNLTEPESESAPTGKQMEQTVAIDPGSK